MNHLLDCTATYHHTVVHYYKYGMIINIHADASYFTESKGCPRVGRNYFLDILPKEGQPIILNDAIQKMCSVINNVAASAAEAELRELFSINQLIKKIDSNYMNLGIPNRLHLFILIIQQLTE